MGGGKVLGGFGLCMNRRNRWVQRYATLCPYLVSETALFFRAALSLLGIGEGPLLLSPFGALIKSPTQFGIALGEGAAGA